MYRNTKTARGRKNNQYLSGRPLPDGEIPPAAVRDCYPASMTPILIISRLMSTL